MTRRLTRDSVAVALRGDSQPPVPAFGLPTASVVVEPGANPAERDATIASLAKLRTAPLEVLVADRGVDAAVSAARGEIVAFTRAGCEVDAGWLDRLDLAFADRLTMATTGYVGPLELESALQCRVERRRGIDRRVRSFVLDGAPDHPDRAFADPRRAGRRAGSGANAFIRRSFLVECGAGFGGGEGPFPSPIEAHAFARILAGGYRINFDPKRVVWCRYRADPRRLRTKAVPRAEAPLRALHRKAANPTPTQVAPELKTDGPDLSVLVPSFERREHLVALLEALARQTHPAERFEVVVVVDGSRDGSAEAARALAVPFRLAVVEQAHSGVGAARNRAATESRAPLLLFLDDDMVPDPGLIAEHLAAHAQSQADLVAIGYCPAGVDGTSLLARLARGWWEDHYLRLAEPDHQWTWFDFSVGNCSLRRELLDHCGGFDESFRRRNEDQELGVRLAESGASFAFLPRASAWHHFETRLAEVLANTRRQGAHDVLLVERHPRLRNRTSLPAAIGADGRPSRKAAIVQRFPHLAAAAMAPAARLAALLEAAGARRAWFALVTRLLATAYLVGARDSIPHAGKMEHIDPGWERPELLRVELGTPAHLRIDAAGREPELAVTLRGAELARLPAMAIGRPWRWSDVIERCTEACAEPLREAVSQDALARLARSSAGHDGHADD